MHSRSGQLGLVDLLWIARRRVSGPLEMQLIWRTHIYRLTLSEDKETSSAEHRGQSLDHRRIVRNIKQHRLDVNDIYRISPKSSKSP